MNSQTPDSLPPSAGRRFLVHACLGRGGFGEVYRATMSSSGGVRTEVAIKVLRADIDPGSEAVKRLRDEGRLLGALRHPAILRVHDLVLLEDRVALVTEFVEGEDLDKCMASVPPMPRRALIGAVGEVAAALDVAWNSPSPTGDEPIHLVHRDVKPANIRIGRHGEVKLLDFGIAHAANVVREAHTANNAMMGSYLYMAPERFHEEKVEPPSDVYALGCILFEGLTGHRLFEGMTLKQIYGTMLLSRKFNAHLDERLKLLPTDLEEPVVTLLRETLDVDPTRRPSAQQVARRSEDLVETLKGATLKRWARSREWSIQQVIAGTLDGRDVSAQSFGTSDSGPRRERAEDTYIHIADAPPDPPRHFDPPGRPPRSDTRGAGIGPLALPPLGMPIFPGSSTLGPTVGPTRQQAIEAPEPRSARTPVPAQPTAAPTPSVAPPAMYEPQGVHGPTAPPVPEQVGAPAAAPDHDPPGATAVPLPQEDTPVRYPRVGEPALFVGVQPEPAMEPIPGVLFDDGTPPSLHDDEFDAQLRAMQARARTRNLAVVVVAAALVVLLASAGIGYALVSLEGAPLDAIRRPLDGGLTATDVTPDPAPPPAEPVKAEAAKEAPAPAPVEPSSAPVEPPQAPVKPPPAAVVRAPSKPPPAPPAAPAPAAKQPSLVDQGWNTVEGDPKRALDLFGRARELGGGAEASYGYGYALMKLGRNDEATTALCDAVSTGDEALKREVRSVMERKGLSCE